jgi:hypothetical protein
VERRTARVPAQRDPHNGGPPPPGAAERCRGREVRPGSECCKTRKSSGYMEPQKPARAAADRPFGLLITHHYEDPSIKVAAPAGSLGAGDETLRRTSLGVSLPGTGHALKLGRGTDPAGLTNELCMLCLPIGYAYKLFDFPGGWNHVIRRHPGIWNEEPIGRSGSGISGPRPRCPLPLRFLSALVRGWSYSGAWIAPAPFPAVCF